MPLQLLDNLRLVSRRQSRSGQDHRELGIFFEHVRQGGQRFGGAVECRGLGGGRVLYYRYCQSINNAENGKPWRDVGIELILGSKESIPRHLRTFHQGRIKQREASSLVLAQLERMFSRRKVRQQHES